MSKRMNAGMSAPDAARCTHISRRWSRPARTAWILAVIVAASVVVAACLPMISRRLLLGRFFPEHFQANGIANPRHELVLDLVYAVALAIAASVVGVMAVAIYTAIWPDADGVTAVLGGVEAIYLAAFVHLAVNGGGAASLDRPRKDDKAAKKDFTPVPPGSYTSGAIILLSDGRRTTGPDPIAAAKLAADRGVRVYTVGFGTKEGAMIGDEQWSFYVRLDEETLKSVAAITGAESVVEMVASCAFKPRTFV